MLLRQQSLLPIHISPLKSAGRLASLFDPFRLTQTRVSPRDIRHITRSLSTLLASGIELERALDFLRSSAKKEELVKLLSQILERVRAGSTLADALRQRDDAFSALYISMIHAGEVGGSLAEACSQAAEHQERVGKTVDEIKSALTYPIILLLTACGSVFVLVAFVLPRFEPLFEGAGSALPLPTRVLMTSGAVMAEYWWVLPVSVIVGVLGGRSLLSNPQARYWLDLRLLNLPIAGRLIVSVQVSRMARTLGTLLKNGIPIVSAVTISRDTVANSFIRKQLSDVAAAIRGGKRLSDELSRIYLFPALASQLIRLGEESGQLENMLLRTADIYEDEAEASIRRLMSLLTPCITIVLGLIVAGIISSVMIALLSLNEIAA